MVLSSDGRHWTLSCRCSSPGRLGHCKSGCHLASNICYNDIAMASMTLFDLGGFDQGCLHQVWIQRGLLAKPIQALKRKLESSYGWWFSTIRQQPNGLESLKWSKWTLTIGPSSWAGPYYQRMDKVQHDGRNGCLMASTGTGYASPVPFWCFL